jgi:hypothetical protein
MLPCSALLSQADAEAARINRKAEEKHNRGVKAWLRQTAQPVLSFRSETTVELKMVYSRGFTISEVRGAHRVVIRKSSAKQAKRRRSGGGALALLHASNPAFPLSSFFIFWPCPLVQLPTTLKTQLEARSTSDPSWLKIVDVGKVSSAPEYQ